MPRVFILALVFSAIAAPQMMAQAKPSSAHLAPEASPNEITPPFPGIIWFEPSERIEARIAASKQLAIKDRRKVGDQWVLTVTGFTTPKPPELARVLFHFIGGSLAKDKGADGKQRERITGGQLVEVELQYEHAGWSEDDYGTCLGEQRRFMESKFGQGQQIVRKSSPTPDGKATQTIVGYKWNKNNTTAQLLYFNVTANEGGQVFHSISVHYKTQ